MPKTEEELKALFSQRLTQIMQEHNINQVELSKILNVSESTVGKWILKKSLPRMGIIQQLADYFSVGKSFFLEINAKEQPYYLDPKMVKLIQDLKDKPKLIQLNRRAKNLSETQLDAIMRITEEFISQDKEMTEIDDDI
jgi:transcriptional regulator with XRE-family HTH domain|nr:MAG TPA: Repressor protein CI [Caudoviricetes sp.]